MAKKKAARRPAAGRKSTPQKPQRRGPKQRAQEAKSPDLAAKSHDLADSPQDQTDDARSSPMAGVASSLPRNRVVGLDLQQFARLIEEIYPDREINAVHVHATVQPGHGGGLDAEAIRAVRKFHTQQLHLADIAQHLTIDVTGTIWTGRHWDRPPVSVAGLNGNTAAGPLMLVMAGAFGTGGAWRGPQREAAAGIVALLERRFGLRNSDVRFAWRCSPVQRAADPLDVTAFLKLVDKKRKQFDSPPAKPERKSPFDESAVDRGVLDVAVGELRQPCTEGADALDELDERLLVQKESRADGDAGSKNVTSKIFFRGDKGMAKFSAYGGSAKASSVSSSRGSDGPGTRSSSPKRALCIGIDNYPHAGDRLAGCVNDATNWGEVFKSQGFEVAMLVDGQATRSGILNAINQLVTTSQPGQVIAIQYAGHGTQIADASRDEDDNQDEALVPFDHRQMGYVIDDNLAAINNLIPSGVNVTYFMDCCHSGSITRLFVGPGTVVDRTVKTRFLRPDAEMMAAYRRCNQASAARGAARSPYDDRNEILIAACRADQTSKERGGQGDFSRYALAVLRQGLDGLSNGNFIDKVVATGSFDDQNPQLWSDPSFRDQPLLGPRTGRDAAGLPSSAGDQGKDALKQTLASIEALVGKLRDQVGEIGN